MINRGSNPLLLGANLQPLALRERHNVSGSSAGWVQSHRKLDKMLYDMMPSTFVEIKEYPMELERKEVATKEEKERGVVMNEFNSPWFSSR